MKKIRDLFVNRETILYLIFGGLTTFVNFGTFVLCDFWLGDQYYLISNILSFIAATIFAFLTNKQLVFESKQWEFSSVLREFSTFVSARIFTFLIIEELGMLLAVRLLNLQKYRVYFLKGTFIAKIVLAFVAVLFNYVLSKFWIFKKEKGDCE